MPFVIRDVMLPVELCRITQAQLEDVNTLFAREGESVLVEDIRVGLGLDFTSALGLGLFLRRAGVILLQLESVHMLTGHKLAGKHPFSEGPPRLPLTYQDGNGDSHTIRDTDELGYVISFEVKVPFRLQAHLIGFHRTQAMEELRLPAQKWPVDN